MTPVRACLAGASGSRWYFFSNTMLASGTPPFLALYYDRCFVADICPYGYIAPCDVLIHKIHSFRGLNATPLRPWVVETSGRKPLPVNSGSVLPL
jgi:hypothetical protein